MAKTKLRRRRAGVNPARLYTLKAHRLQHAKKSQLVCCHRNRPSLQDRIEGGEQRWQTLGIVGGLILLTVAHVVREEYEQGTSIEIIRIISARRATLKERRCYEEEKG